MIVTVRVTAELSADTTLVETFPAVTALVVGLASVTGLSEADSGMGDAVANAAKTSAMMVKRILLSLIVV